MNGWQLFFAAGSLLASGFMAQAARGETSLTLDIGFGIRYVPPARVTVPAGELLRISAPALGPLQWSRNGRAIAGATSTTLTIDSVQGADAGSYSATYTDPAMAGRGTQGLILGVGPADRLLNLSVRGTVNAGPGQNFLAGFVVAPGTSGKKLILRAIGPSLAAYGIADPLARPALRILDARGASYQNGYVYPAVVGGPTYESDLADSLARCGAFPISPGTRDVVIMMPFVSGSYVAEVTSGDLAAGTVLFEIYEVP